MPIFTDNVSRIEAPNNTALAIEISNQIGKANPGKAISDALKDWAGDVHDYTYGTAMGIANDIKTARDEYGNLKDKAGRFVNSNSRIQELLAQKNPKWSANNYADADMEAWYKGRDTEGRAIEDLILKKDEGKRSQQRLNLQIQQAANQARKDKLLEEAQALKANYLKAKEGSYGATWLQQNQARLDANPYAKSDIYGIAGNDLLEFSPDDLKSKPGLINPQSITDAIRLEEEKARTLANTQGMSTIFDENGEVVRKTGNDFFKKLVEERDYKGSDVSNFKENWQAAYAAIHAKYPNLNDTQIGAILYNTVQHRSPLTGNIFGLRVDDWGVGGNNTHLEMAESMSGLEDKISAYKTIKENIAELEAFRDSDVVRSAQATYASKLKNIDAAMRAGRISAAEAQNEVGRATAELNITTDKARRLIHQSLLNSAGIPRSLKKPE